MYKHFIIIFILLFSIQSSAQVIDTVCIGTIRNYKVQGDVGSVYNWQINGGNIISNPTKDSIIVKWGNIGGIFQIFVIETNIFGCFGDTVFAKVLVKQDLPIAINGDNEICLGDTVLLTAVNTTSYQWNNGVSNQSIEVHPLVNTQYRLIGNTVCRIDTAYHNITVNPKPQANFIYSPEFPFVGENVNLSYSGTTAVNYQWFDSLNNLFSNQTNPVFVIQESLQTIINLRVSNQYGCMDSISKTIIANGSINIWIPNSFTPNGDGLNDVFKAESVAEVEGFQFYIYNRWGQLVFESKNISTGWDGKYQGNEVLQGVYNWVIIYISDNKRKILQKREGQITLYR
jgi:gliding motility-associated-like protein